MASHNQKRLIARCQTYLLILKTKALIVNAKNGLLQLYYWAARSLFFLTNYEKEKRPCCSI